MTSAQATVAGFGMISLTAACPVGKHVIAGGFESLANAVQFAPVASYPLSADTWRVVLRNTTSATLASVQLRVYAFCAF
jgi:hypothetical protein